MRRKRNLSLRNGHLSLQIAKIDSESNCPICNDQFAMTNLHWLVAATVFLALCVAGSTCLAGGDASPPSKNTSREIYVPFSDLHVLLENQPKRVLLGREEYDELVKKAKKSPETHAPQSALIVSADYAVTAAGQRAEIRGTLAIDVLETGLHALPLDIGSVGLESATLDGRNASIGRDAAGRLVLFVESVGQHKLVLDMVAPLDMTAARQVLNFRLPRPAAAKLRLEVAGDVEIKGGADVISRTVDAAAKVTRFELLPHEGDNSILMTLNSHLQRQDRAVVASSVLVDEITEAYEKLYATVSLSVLYRAVDQFRFVVPEGFEIAEVTSPLLARWDVQTEGGRKVLGVKLREQTTEKVVLNIAAIRTPAKLEGWTAPRLEPLDVVGSAAVFGLLVEDRLKAESLATGGLIPIETTVLGNVLPAALAESGPDQMSLRAVAAWYAPQSDFSLTAQFKKPPAELAVTTSLLLVVADKGQEVFGGLAFLPQVERRFSFDVFVPAGWQVASVTTAAGQPLPFERYADGRHPNPLPKGEGTAVVAPKGEGTADVAGRIRVTVPGGMAIGQEFKANFRAVCTPPGWMADWKSTPLGFPKFAVLDATRVEGAVAVDVRDDLDVRPEKIAGLKPLDAADKPKYGLANVSTRLAYRIESPDYAASLAIDRTRPRLIARTLSFVRVEPSSLACHYELTYTIEEARTRRLAFSLPKDTPASISIVALDGAKLKEYTPEVVGDRRRWNVSLVEAVGDSVRLAVEFQQPVSAAIPAATGGQNAREPAHASMALPIVAADGVAHQSGLVAVEGCAELEVLVRTPARSVDVDELAGAKYQPGRRLLGAYGFAGDPPPVKIDVLRHRGYAIYRAIVQECELDTNLSPEGESQTRARFKLMTKALYLQVKLPANAELWSAELDGVALKPQREGDSILIDVPAGKSDAAQWLQVVYAAPVDAVALRGTVDVSAPKLLLRAEQREVPLADLVWRLHLPSGYEVVASGGTVASDDIKRPSPAAVEIAQFLFKCNSDLSQYSPLGATLAARKSAKKIDCKNSLQQIGIGLRNYDASNRVLLPSLSAERPASEEGLKKIDVKGLYTPTRRGRVVRGPEVDRLIAEKTAELNAVRDKLKTMARESGGSESETVSMKEKLRIEELQLNRLELAKNRAAAGGKRESGFIETMNDVDVAAVPFDDNSPIVYPNDSKEWAELTAKRKKTLGAIELSERGDGETATGSTTTTSDSSREDLRKESATPSAVWTGGGVDYGGCAGRHVSFENKPGQDLTGNRSLKIDVVQSPSGADQVLRFYSLGVEPKLVVTLANRTRLSALGWGLALLVGLIGVAITRRPMRKKTAFVLTVAVLATIVPLATGSIEIAELCNMVFYAACLLALYYLVVGASWTLLALCRRLCPCCTAKAVCSTAAKSSATVLLMAFVMDGVCGEFIAKPQAAFAGGPESNGGPYVIQVVEPAAPVNVPDDAIILPYDPDWRNGIKDADRVLVPYDRYVELWNAVHPDKKIETKAPPAPFALAGAAYKTLLDGDEYLLVTGQLEIDVFSDGFVTIPLGLGGGVLAQAELDGKPARLAAASDPFAGQQPNMQQSAKPQAAAQSVIPDRSLVVLYVSGKGRHKLDLSVRLKLSRQGGWRIVQGVLPAAPASAISIVVPKPRTELRLGQVHDRRKYDTERPDETIRTALGPGGAMIIAWRPTVAEGQTDRSLTAVSAAVLDVQEDGLQLVWQLGLEFRRSQREQFSVNLPAGYLLKKVEGSNVRGWEIRKTDRGQTAEVTLLQPAKDYEKFTLRLWRAGAVGQANLAEFDVPQVTIADAALHTGQLTLRRSPLLELRTLDRSGVTRTDLPPGDAGATIAAGGEESALGIRPFEAYTFAAVPFRVRLAAAPVAARVSANVQTVLKLAEYERLLESRVIFDVQNRPALQLRMLLPDNLRVDRVWTPGAFHYAITKQDGRPLLTVYLAIGQQGDVPVVVSGRLGGEKAIAELPLPQLQVLDVDRQQGDVAIQVDPAFEVDAVGLANCDPVLLYQLSGWLNDAQLRGTRLGLHCRQGDYAGTLRLRPRKPEVTCDTITNVRLTDRALEETIFLNFTINNAGIRTVSFLLPADMADSRVSSVPMSRQKPTIEPIGKEPGSPLRVTVELQEEVMDELHVLVKNDLLLTPGSHEAPVPVVELGRTNRRYVVIQNAGRDEVVVESAKLRDVEPLAARQKEWEMLKGTLGREMTMAYLVSSDAREPRLPFHTESRAAVATMKARIGLAETTLLIDDNGAYRAEQVYHMDNATGQFLEIQLPEGADLWAARVADEAVKPTALPGATDPLKVRIPIIKTAPGDLYYKVSLKYGGAMPALGSLGAVNFPLIRCLNITPDLSQVRLLVPRNRHWFDFGGTMRQVAEEADLQAGYVKFQTKQTEQIASAMRQGDKWTKARAAGNLKVQKLQIEKYRSDLSSDSFNANLQSELAVNSGTLLRATEDAAKQEIAPAEETIQDNRQRLDAAFHAQKASRARNVVNDLGANFAGVAAVPQGQPQPSGGSGQQFNNDWMVQNGLTLGDNVLPQDGGDKTMPDQFGKGGGMVAGRGMNQQAGVVLKGNAYRGAQVHIVDEPEVLSQAVQQPSAAQVVNPSQQMEGRLMFGVGINSDAGLVGNAYGGQAQTSNGGQYVQSGQNGYSQTTTPLPPVPPAPASERQAGAGESRPAIVNGLVSDRRTADSLVMPPAATPEPAACMPPLPRASAETADAAKKSDVCYSVVKPSPEGRAQAAQQAAAGLASLDFELPADEASRWTVYRFTTPLGNQEITARNASNDLVRRLVEIGVVAGVLLLAWLVAAVIRRGQLRWLARPIGSTLLVCLGLISLFIGIVPLAGLVALLAGCGLKIRRWTSPAPTA